MRLNFGNSLPAAGTFTSIAITPTSNFTNPSNYGTAMPGSINATVPNTNEQVDVVLVPEPAGAIYLAVALALAALHRGRPGLRRIR